MTKRIILIGGTSHAGKSSVARALADRLGWTTLSTDSLARHPGRPWGHVRPHVADHYRDLSVEALINSVMQHYDRMRPAICEVAVKSDRLVFEGSALLPRTIVRLSAPAAILTASDHLFKERMHGESDYAGADASSRLLIDKFLARALRFNELVVREAEALGIPVIHVDDETRPAEIAKSVATSLLGP